MEQSLSSKANLFSASQEIPRNVWNLKVHFRVTSARHLPLSEPDRSSPSADITLLADPFYCYNPIEAWVFQVVSFSQITPTKTLYTPLLSPMGTTSPGHLILLNLIIRIIYGQEYRLLSSSLCSFFFIPVLRRPS